MIWWPLRCVNLLKPLVFTLPGTMEFFEKNGFPGWTAIPVFILELVCGGFLMLGLLRRCAAGARIPVTIDSLIVALCPPRECRPAGESVAVNAHVARGP